MRLCQAQTEAHAQVAWLRRLVCRAGILGDVEAGDADGAAGSGDRHQRVENGRWRFFGVLGAVPTGLEAHRVDRCVHFRHPKNLLDEHHGAP